MEAVAAFTLPTYWSDLYIMLTETMQELRDAARRRAEDMVTEALRDGCHAPVRVTVEEGPAGDVLVRRAAGAELLVVASRSRSRLAGMMLGSVALHCAVHAPCPVMVVHQQPAVQPQPVPEMVATGG